MMEKQIKKKMVQYFNRCVLRMVSSRQRLTNICKQLSNETIYKLSFLEVSVHVSADQLVKGRKGRKRREANGEREIHLAKHYRFSVSTLLASI